MIDIIRKQSANFKDDFFSGLTVALALVPEAVAFAFVAGVDPLIGLYAAFMIGLITSIFGGRPGILKNDHKPLVLYWSCRPTPKPIGFTTISGTGLVRYKIPVKKYI